jgi:hypothetical protein
MEVIRLHWVMNASQSWGVLQFELCTYGLISLFNRLSETTHETTGGLFLGF